MVSALLPACLAFERHGFGALWWLMQMARSLAPGSDRWFYFTDSACPVGADQARIMETQMQLRIFALGMFAVSLTACDVTSTLTEGSKQARAVESALETSTGVKPNVGFNWQN